MSTSCIQGLELSCQVALQQQSQFDVAFCRDAVASIKKLASSEQDKCKSLLCALCDHLFASLQTIEAVDVACMFDALAVLKAERPRAFWEAVCARGKEVAVLHQFQLSHLADMLEAAAKLKASEWCGELIQALSDEAAQLIEDSDKVLLRQPSIMANVLWAFATMQQPVPERLLHLLLAKCPQIPHEHWRARHVATICYSLARLNVSSHKACLDFLSQQTCLDLWKSYSAKHISDTLWAYATVRKSPDTGLVKVLTQRAIEKMRQFSIEDLSNLFHALASLKKDCQWSSRLLVKMCDHAKSLSMDDFGHHHVSAIMWSLVTLYQDGDGLPSKLGPEALDFMMRLLQRLPKLAGDATPHFLVHTMHAMASVQRFSQGQEEDDTTYIRRSTDEGARHMPANERINEQKAEVWKQYAARLREVVSSLDSPLLTAMLWSMRMLALHPESDLLTVLTKHALTLNERDVNVVDIMWTHGVLWSKPDDSLLILLHSRIMAGADKLSLTNVTRLLWGLSAMYAQQGQGDVDWRTVLDKLAIMLLKHQHELDAIHIKQLHQFFLTCNTSRALVDVLPDSIFEVKEKLEDRCCRDVREASAAQRLEHSLGDGCAAQLRKLGLECSTEEECPNTGYNLDLRFYATPNTPPNLQPPDIMGHRGWVLEIDRPCHYLAASRTLKEGRCRLREAHLEGVGYSLTVIPHWEWEHILRKPDDHVLAYLTEKLQTAFADAQKKFIESEGAGM
eukprot:Tamp_06727.p1 GENE.Tamp_06727~~Tamp_06727.p1  ORF type:complete len:839 (-),score=173.29 Tamp_06727:131-2332(-)